MNMWSLACLEAGEPVLLLILLPVFDTGSFITNLYLPYLLDALRGWLFVSTGLASSSGIGLGALGQRSILQRADKEFHSKKCRFSSLAQLDEFSRSF